MPTDSPFHGGEIQAQRRAGAGDVASQVSGFIRSYLPEQHREFHSSLPFMVVAGADADGRPWVTLLEGDNGFISSPTATSLEIRADVSAQDPLATALREGTDVGLLGIEFATRRRNRLSGFARWSDGRYLVDVSQTFGNCPQYIHQRDWHRVPAASGAGAQRSQQLSAAQMDRIRKADTLFIGTGQRDQQDAPSNGYDASHRGGAPGFVEVVDRHRLRIPDYAGNNFFNSIGNILRNPKIGMLFVDFETGDLLHISGRAKVDWNPEASSDPGALRVIDVEVVEVIDRPGAVSLRWSADSAQFQSLAVAKKAQESDQITSLYLVSADGEPLPAFEPGQHLPIRLTIPGQSNAVERSYSLSGPSGQDFYRLSIKREFEGLASRFVHDQLRVGDIIRAGAPAGDFVIPCGHCPLVLVSAGVGLTPMMSMLYTSIHEPGDRPIWFIHGAKDGRQHAMRAEVERIARAAGNVQKRFYYSRPQTSDRLGIDYDHTGRISTESLLELGAGADAHYLLCGPAAFVSSLESGLESAGVPAAQIHFETF